MRVKVVEGAGRWEKEHILVMQHKAGRRLARGEMVHHINGKRNDNDLSNLFLCKDHAEHMRIHASAMSVIYELLRDGLVVFNRKLRRYERVL